MGLFGKSKTSKETVQELNSKLRKEGNQLDRQIRSIQREEEKVKRSLKDAAKKGDKDVCKILAKEIIQSRKAVNKLYTAKAHINSVGLNMKNQLATLRISGAIQQSTEVMVAMQRLVKVPEVSQIMQEMSREMMKAGIIEEMMEDTMESVLEDDDELEEEAEEEVEKLLWEVTAGHMGLAPAAGSDALPTPAAAPAQAEADSDEEDLEEMKNRLEALKS